MPQCVEQYLPYAIPIKQNLLSHQLLGAGEAKISNNMLRRSIEAVSGANNRKCQFNSKAKTPPHITDSIACRDNIKSLSEAISTETTQLIPRSSIPISRQLPTRNLKSVSKNIQDLFEIPTVEPSISLEAAPIAFTTKLPPVVSDGSRNRSPVKE